MPDHASDALPLVRTPSGICVQTPAGHLQLGPILGIGRNYAEHAREQSEAVPDRPMVFVKTPNALALDGEPITIPAVARDPGCGGNQTDYEAELAVILGAPVLDASEAEGLAAVLGYACANDVSARWWQKQGSGGQFTRGKSFDSFCPIGPFVIPASAIPDPQTLPVRCVLNGDTMQDGTTADMVHSVGALIAELSRGTTLNAGTVILTGTPSGVGMARKPQVWLQDGDTVTVKISGVGTLTNPVRFG